MIPLLLAQLCIAEFYLGKDQSQIRIKKEVGTFKHVEAFQYFFLLTVPRRYGVASVDRIINLYFMFIFVMLSSDLNVKKVRAQNCNSSLKLRKALVKY